MNIAIAGLGKVATEQHVPAIFALPGIELVSIASPHHGLDGIPWYPTLEDLLAHEPAVDAVVLCSPASLLLNQAALALEAGRHVMLDRPSYATLTGLGRLIEIAQRARLTLMAGWPARFGAAVQPARELLAAHGATAARIRWDRTAACWPCDRNWQHDGNGIGVFHGGIDALSILTRLVPERLAVTTAALWFPTDGAVPVAAELTLAGPSGLLVQAHFDGQSDAAPPPGIEVETRDGTLLLLDGCGDTLQRDGQPVALQPSLPYRGLYQHFLHLAETGTCDLDVGPLMHVADAHLLARRMVTDAIFNKGD